MAQYPSVYAGTRLTAALVRSWLPLTVVKTSTESITSSTTLQNDDELLLPVEASAQYILGGMIRYQASSAGDLKLAWSYPTGATMNWVPHGIGSAETTLVGQILTQSQTISSQPTLGGPAGLTSIARLTGHLIVSTTAGNLQLQWAQGTSDATATSILSGSHLRLERIA